MSAPGRPPSRSIRGRLFKEKLALLQRVSLHQMLRADNRSSDRLICIADGLAWQALNIAVERREAGGRRPGMHMSEWSA